MSRLTDEKKHLALRCTKEVSMEPYQTMVRRDLRKMPTSKLQEAYEKLKGGKPTGIELV